MNNSPGAGNSGHAPSHEGIQSKSAPINKGGTATPMAPGKMIFKGRIVTPTQNGKLKDGSTTRLAGNRMKTRSWSGKR
jgi:hypothetical protein